MLRADVMTQADKEKQAQKVVFNSYRERPAYDVVMWVNHKTCTNHTVTVKHHQ